MRCGRAAVFTTLFLKDRGLPGRCRGAQSRDMRDWVHYTSWCSVVSTPFGVDLKIFTSPDFHYPAEDFKVHAVHDVERVVQRVVALGS